MPSRIIKPFKPHPWQVKPWRDTSPVMLLTGSAGGGKSRLAAEKLHGYCLKYPGTTALLLRKSRAVIGNSTLLFLRRQVVGDEEDGRVKCWPSKFRFEYTNGSILAWAGMKDEEQREFIRSFGSDGGIDIAWMEEATQFVEADFNELIARMRGSAAPWRQIMLSTNPDHPLHWIYRRLIIGRGASVHYSGETDNPSNPDDYANMLALLTGVEKKRLVQGVWAAGSGLVVDTWLDVVNEESRDDGGGNVSFDAEYIPDGGEVIWTIDDGYSGKKDDQGLFTHHSHPRAFLLCQIRPNGTIAVFAESFEVQILAEDHIAKVKAMSLENGWAIPRWAIRDRAAASLDGALKKADILCRYNTMTVDESLKELRQWVGKDKNGVRRFIAHPRCFYLRHQMNSYSQDEDGKIIKQFDDGPDAARYLVWDREYGVNPNVDVVTWRDVEGELAAYYG